MRLTIITLLSLLFCFSCNKDFKSEKDTPIGVINAMWKFIDENYVFIDLKNLDMEALKTDYLSQVSETTSEEDLFQICTQLLYELQDGHCFLNNGINSVRFDPAQDYNSGFNLELIEQNYIQGNLEKYEFFSTGMINDSTAYMHLNEFENVNEINAALYDFSQFPESINKIIVDIRNNSGGDPQVALTTASNFMPKDIFLGQIIHKNGKAHDDFTPSVDLFSEEISLIFEQQVRLLIDKNSFSASSYLAGMLQHRDNVLIMGETTDGGGGDVTSIELPNGWVLAVTVNFFLDAQGNHIENGVILDFEIINTLDQLELGIDQVLEEALNE